MCDILLFSLEIDFSIIIPIITFLYYKLSFCNMYLTKWINRNNNKCTYNSKCDQNGTEWRYQVKSPDKTLVRWKTLYFIITWNQIYVLLILNYDWCLLFEDNSDFLNIYIYNQTWQFCFVFVCLFCDMSRLQF
jgi:hypothetical protein